MQYERGSKYPVADVLAMYINSVEVPNLNYPKHACLHSPGKRHLGFAKKYGVPQLNRLVIVFI